MFRSTRRTAMPSRWRSPSTRSTTARASSQRWHPGLAIRVRVDAGTTGSVTRRPSGPRAYTRPMLEEPAAARTLPVAAFFDIDKTLVNGASLLFLARAARTLGVVRMHDLVRFGWEAV